MDGNGRWARRRGLPRLAGHRAGTENIRRIVSECAALGVSYLTLYAFSTENWTRPQPEVDGLMRILVEFLERETNNLHREGVQIRHYGTMNNVADLLRTRIERAIALTANNDRLVLGVAFNYGGRAEIVDAVRTLVAAGAQPHEITEQAIGQHLSTGDVPDPDLIIRTSGEFRISNFLIWQAAYSELWVTPDFWPDFGADHLRQAINDYAKRERRFGGLTKET